MADRDRTRRPTLRALAKARGMDGLEIWQEVKPMWDACAWDDFGEPVVEIRTPTRRAATEGLRAALQALPEVKKERKR